MGQPIKMDNFFTFINHINSILFLLVLIAAAVTLVWSGLNKQTWRPRGVVQVAAEAGAAPVLLSLSHVERIHGSGMQMARLVAREKTGKFTSTYYRADIAMNILFISDVDQPARWLFQGHGNRILAAEQLGESSADSGSSAIKGKTLLLYFEYIATGKNARHDRADADQQLGPVEYSNIGLSKPDGSGFTEVLDKVSSVLSYELNEQGQLSIIYQQAAMVRHARIAVDQMKLLSDTDVTQLPCTI